MQEGMHIQESWSRVRGNDSSSVGIAKIPVYSIKHSLLSDRAAREICPASNCEPEAKIAKLAEIQYMFVFVCIRDMLT